jgi:nucleoid DNA-binding protein
MTIEVIAEVLRETLGLTNKQARLATINILYALTRELTNKKYLLLPRFGAFYVTYPKRVTKQTLTNKPVQQTLTVKFTASLVLRDHINKKVTVLRNEPEPGKPKSKAKRPKATEP